MDIKSPVLLPEATVSLTHHYIGRDENQYEETQTVLTEHCLEITVNHTLKMSFVCLPQHLTELIIGHLATERLIQSIDEIEQILFDASGTKATVTLTHPLPTNLPDLEAFPPVFWKNEWIFALADRFADGMPIHQATCATHSCFLSIKDQLLFECEDIGRHNALDKTIGYALMQNLPFQECILYSSGRVPTDMLKKALHAGFPTLVSKGAPTAQTVALARQYRMNLICAARRDRMKLFSDSNV